MYLITSTVLVLLLVLLAENKKIKKESIKYIKPLAVLSLSISAMLLNIIDYGYEFGLTYLFLQLSCIAWFIIYLKREKKYKKAKNKIIKVSLKLNFSITNIIQCLKVITQLLRNLAIPTLGSTAISFLIPTLFKEQSSNVLIFSIFSFFLILPILVILYMNTKKSIKKDIIFISLSLLLLSPHYFQ